MATAAATTTTEIDIDDTKVPKNVLQRFHDRDPDAPTYTLEQAIRLSGGDPEAAQRRARVLIQSRKRTKATRS